MAELMEHQKRGAAWLSTLCAGLLHWDMGTGKTATAIAACDLTQSGATKPVLVLCPAVARRTWAREFQAWGRVDRAIHVIESAKTARTDADVIVCSYDLAARMEVWRILATRSWDILILDELQQLKTPKARRTRAVFGGKPFDRRGLADRATSVWALSGTPAPNAISELYPWVRFAAPDLIPGTGPRPMTFWRFAETYCRLEDSGWGSRIVGNNVPACQKLWAGMAGITDRVRKTDVLDDLPPIRFALVPLAGDRTAAQVRRMEQAQAEDLAAVIEAIKAGEPAPVSHVATLRRLTELAKVGDALALLRDELTDRALDKVVVFALHHDTIDALAGGLEAFGAVTIDGRTPASGRQQAIDRFQSDPATRVFIGQVTAAGTAITLHAGGACQNVVFVGADWVPGANAQAAARVWRKGQTGAVLCRFLTLDNSIDDAIGATLARKAADLDAVFGDRRPHHAA